MTGGTSLRFGFAAAAVAMLLAACSDGPSMPRLGDLNPFAEKEKPLPGKRVPVALAESKAGLQVSTYIGMGWAALVCIQDINDRLGAIDKVAGIGQGVWLLFVGGVLYTVGVPFFVRDKRTIGIPDHTIWHLFVMAASAAHYYCVLLYLVPFPYEGVPLPWADACGEACIRV